MSTSEYSEALTDLGDVSRYQIHVAGDFYNGPITNSAVGGRGNTNTIENSEASKAIIEELRKVSDFLFKKNAEADDGVELTLGEEWTRFRGWLKKDPATLSLTREVPGTLSLSKMPRVEKAIKNLEADLIPSSTSTETRVFNLKMLGDCYRYQARLHTGSKSELENIVFKSWEAYTEASRLSESQLDPTNPVRLGVAVGYALFYHHIVKSSDRACYILHEAWKAGSDAMSGVPEDEWRDYADMLQRVRTWLTMCASDISGDDDDDDDDELLAAEDEADS